MTNNCSTEVNGLTIMKGAFRRVWKPYGSGVAFGLFITLTTFFVAKLGFSSIASKVLGEALGPNLACFFLVIWGLQAGITWRRKTLDWIEDWTLNLFLTGTGAISGAAITLIVVIKYWLNLNLSEPVTKLFYLTVLVTVVAYALAAAAAYLREHPSRKDARLLRRLLGVISAITLVFFLTGIWLLG